MILGAYNLKYYLKNLKSRHMCVILRYYVMVNVFMVRDPRAKPVLKCGNMWWPLQMLVRGHIATTVNHLISHTSKLIKNLPFVAKTYTRKCIKETKPALSNCMLAISASRTVCVGRSLWWYVTISYSLSTCDEEYRQRRIRWTYSKHSML